MDVRGALARHGSVRVRVASGSMAPTLVLGEDVLVCAAEPEVGDVVLLDTPGAPTLHRLVARLGSRWVHAGDARRALPGLAAVSSVLGVAAIERRVPSLLQRARLVASALARAIV